MKLRRLEAAEVAALDRRAVDSATLIAAAEIVEAVKAGGERAVRRFAERFDEVASDGPLLIGREEINSALDQLPAGDRRLLVRTAARIDRFAALQKVSLTDLSLDIAGGRAGHQVEPVGRACLLYTSDAADDAMNV